MTLKSFLDHHVDRFDDELLSRLLFWLATAVSFLYEDWLMYKFNTNSKGRNTRLMSGAAGIVELLDCVGLTKERRNYFAAATCHFEPTQHAEIYDLPTDSGEAHTHALEEVISNEGNLFLAKSI